MPDVVLETMPLAAQWPTLDPFLFCAHHRDGYPNGDGALGPSTGVGGRPIGQDFGGIDGWNMYHGATVPGFPAHPHRGFETITYVREGWCDHSDSLGAQARFGEGDVQWLTAGKGIVHSEMFPLLHVDKPNPLHLFQIWLNLPARSKMVDPYFSMMWGAEVPRWSTDTHGGEVVAVVGAIDGRGLEPPPDSWAADPSSDVAIWHVTVRAGHTVDLPAAAPTSNRVVYVFAGEQARIDDIEVSADTGVVVRADAQLPISARAADVECLVLTGRPIGEPVAQYGPFVMSTEAEIRQALDDYQRTRFGGWPWTDEAPTHGDVATRFANHATGRVEQPF